MTPFQQELQRRFYYSVVTGQFWYRIPVAQMRPGDIAGRPNTNGHIQISVNSKRYMAHNLAHYYLLGGWPKDELDHINNDPACNAWHNLRDATREENMSNRTEAARIFLNRKGKWEAVFYFRRKRYHLGSYFKRESAVEMLNHHGRKIKGEFHKDV